MRYIFGVCLGCLMIYGAIGNVEVGGSWISSLITAGIGLAIALLCGHMYVRKAEK
jgi:hypothetical protein